MKENDHGPIDRYDLKSYQYPGLLVIYNQENFDNGLQQRQGTRKDATRLQDVFQRVAGFRVILHHDLNFQEIKNTLLTATKCEENEYGSLIVIVLTHGRMGGQISAKDRFYHASELWETVSTSGCFKNKPKAFLLQACRGAKTMATFGRENMAIPTFQPSLTMELHSLFAFSTVEGYEAYRSKSSGSFYIQCLCDVMESHREIDIENVLTRVNQLMVNANTPGRTAETPTFTSLLRNSFIIESKEAEIKNKVQVEDWYKNEEEFCGPAVLFHEPAASSIAKNYFENFDKLNFRCQSIPYEPTTEVLENLVETRQLAASNFVVIILLFQAKHHPRLKKMVEYYLSATKCPDMQGKPKLVFLVNTSNEEVSVKDNSSLNDNLSRPLNLFTTNHSDFLFVHIHSTDDFPVNFELNEKFDLLKNIQNALSSSKKMPRITENPSYIETTLQAQIYVTRQHKKLNFLDLNVMEYNIRDPVTFYFDRPCISKIQDALTGAYTTHKVDILIHSMPGAGKSQLILKYISKFRHEFKYLFWLDATTPNTLELDFKNIATKLQISYTEKQPIEEIIQNLYEILSKKSGQTLLVFQNINKSEDVYKKYFPKVKGNIFRTIVTSISKPKSSDSEYIKKEMSLGPFEPEESFQFLKNVFKNVTISDEKLNEISSLCDHFPSILSLIANTIVEKVQNKNLDESSIQLEIEDIFQTFRKQSGTPTDKAINVAINYLNQISNFSSIELLEYLAFCEPNLIPLTLLKNMKSEYNENKELLKSLLPIYNLSIISISKKSYNILSIYQDAIIKRIKIENRYNETLQRSLEFISNLQELKTTTPLVKKSYVKHALKICRLSHVLPVYEETIMRFHTMLNDLSEIGHYKTAIEYCEDISKMKIPDSYQFNFFKVNILHLKSEVLFPLDRYQDSYDTICEAIKKIVQMCEKSISLPEYPSLKSDPKTKIDLSFLDELRNFEIPDEYLNKKLLRFLNNLALLFSTVSLYSEAISIYDHIFKINVEIDGQYDINTLITMHNKAEVVAILGDFESALKLYDEIIKISQDHFDNENIVLSKTLNSKAVVLVKLGKLEDALKMYQQAVKIEIKILGEDHPNIFAFRVNIGSVLRQLGRLKEAKILLQDILEAQKNSINYMGENMYTLRAMHVLGAVLGDLNEKEEAMSIAIKVIELKSKILGENHYSTLATMTSLANYKLDLGDYYESLKINFLVLNKYKEFFSNRHLDICVVANTIAITYIKQKRYDVAISFIDEHLNSLSIPENHPSKIKILISKSEALLGIGENETALEIIENVLNLKSDMNREHPTILVLYHIKARALTDMGKFDEALQLISQNIEIENKIYGPDHSQTLSSRHEIAMLLTKKDMIDDALEIHNEVIEKYKLKLEFGHYGLLHSLKNKATLLKNHERWEEAYESYLEILTLKEKKFGDGHDETLETLQDIIKILVKLNNYSKAIQIYNRILKSSNVNYEKQSELIDLINTIKN